MCLSLVKQGSLLYQLRMTLLWVLAVLMQHAQTSDIVGQILVYKFFQLCVIERGIFIINLKIIHKNTCVCSSLYNTLMSMMLAHRYTKGDPSSTQMMT